MNLDEEIKRVTDAINRSKSDKLKRDYTKYLRKLRNRQRAERKAN